MTTTFFTADLHLGHDNIRRHCNRPFENSHDMNSAIIRNWNSVVSDRDTVWVLGDFCYRSKPADVYLKRLKGRKNLIIGNHDSRDTIRSKLWDKVFNLETLKIDGEKIVLCHYGMRVWDSSFHGSWHLFGHSHGRLPPTTIVRDGKEIVRSFDVGVDSWDFTPISFDKVRDIMNGKKKPRWAGDQRLADMEIGKIDPDKRK